MEFKAAYAFIISHLNLIFLTKIQSTMKQFAFLFLFAAMAFAFTACNEADDDATADVEDSNVLTSEDLTAMEGLVFDAEDEIEAIIENGLTAEGEIEVREDECPTRTVEPEDGTFPRTITIDYGESCMTSTGREKSGQIVIEQTAARDEPGATRTITFVNYFVDGANLQGSSVRTNNGTDENGNPSYTRTRDLTIVYPNGDQASWMTTHTTTKINGADTPRFIDDVFSVTGSSSGTNREGNTFSAEILEPIVKARRCPWPRNGIRQVSRNDNTATIDYGFGGEDCDNRAQVTLPDGTTRVIRIEPWWRR